MKKLDRFYIDGEWQSIKNTQFIDIINPANKECVGSLSMGNDRVT